MESPSQRFLFDQSPSGAYDLSPATEIDLDSMLIASESQLDASKSYEAGIEDVTAGILNDTSDDFVSSILNSVDMSMTIMSDGGGDQTLTESATTGLVSKASEEARAAPDICEDKASKGGLAAEEVNDRMIPKGPTDSVWKKFRITSPFSVKPQPTVHIRPVSTRLPVPSFPSVVAAEVQTSPYYTSTKESIPCMSQASSTVSLAASSKETTQPFSSDGESDKEVEPFQQLSTPVSSLPTNVPRFKTLFQANKGSKDPMKMIKGTKIRKTTTKKKNKSSNQHWKSHLGNLVERLRSVGIDYYNDTSCFPDMSPERPLQHLDNNSPEPDTTRCRQSSQKSSKIPRPIDSMSQVKISTFDAVNSSRKRAQTGGIHRSALQKNDAIRTAMEREISQIRDLGGVAKVRKLELFAKEYLRQLDNETFEWALAQLSGNVHPDFIKAEEEYRRIMELVAVNPKFNTGDPADPWRVFAQVKLKSVE